MQFEIICRLPFWNRTWSHCAQEIGLLGKVYITHTFPWWVKLRYKADFRDNELFHLVQLTAENQEGMWMTVRFEDGRGSLSSTWKAPSNSSSMPFGSLSRGGSWHMEVYFHFVPVSQVNNLEKKQTEGCLLTFQTESFRNGACRAVLQ